MSASDAPPGVRDLTGAERRGPARQEAVREPPERPASRSYYEETVKVPGYGRAPDRCRRLQPVGFCDHGHVTLGRSSCGTRRCPDHWRDWLEDAVVKQTARLAAYRAVQEGAGKRLLHVVASPPQDRHWTADAFWNARSRSYEVVEEAGVRGGVAVAHPYRSSEAGDELFATATEHGDWEEEDGMWSLFRDSADDWEAMDDLVEAAPHYHLLAACEDFDPDGVPSGWVAKNIRSLPRFHVDDVEAYRPMARVAYYLLTHAGVQKDRQTVTHFGEVHPAAFDPEEELGRAKWRRVQELAERAVKERPGEGVRGEEEQRECPRDGCEAHVVPIDELHEWLDGDGDWVRSLEPRQRLEIRGVQAWAELGDRPPPAVAGDKQRLRQWLVDKGRMHFGTLGEMRVQAGLGAFT